MPPASIVRIRKLPPPFGVNCANGNTESINMVNDICNRAGIDTISGRPPL